MKFKRIELKWHDPTSEDAWHDIENIMTEPSSVWTCGYLLRECDKYYVVALSIGPEDDRTSQTLIIPKVLVYETTIFPDSKPVLLQSDSSGTGSQ